MGVAAVTSAVAGAFAHKRALQLAEEDIDELLVQVESFDNDSWTQARNFINQEILQRVFDHSECSRFRREFYNADDEKLESFPKYVLRSLRAAKTLISKQ